MTEPTTPPLHFTLYRGIDQLPEADWRTAVAPGQTFMSPDYYRALEDVALPGMEYRYAVMCADQRPVGAASLQLICFEPQTVCLRLQAVRFSNAGRTSILWRCLRHLAGTSRKLLVCGNAFASGMHGLALTAGIGSRAAGVCLWRIIRQVRGDTDIFAVLIKDLQTGDGHADLQAAAGPFLPLQIGPRMTLDLSPELRGRSDYLAALRPKHRQRTLKAFARAHAVTRRRLEHRDLIALKPDIQRLHTNVRTRAGFTASPPPICCPACSNGSTAALSPPVTSTRNVWSPGQLRSPGETTWRGT